MPCVLLLSWLAAPPDPAPQSLERGIQDQKVATALIARISRVIWQQIVEK